MDSNLELLRMLREVDVDSLNVQDYVFKVVLLHRSVTAGARGREIPVRFIDRTVAESKLGLREILEFIINAL